MNLSDEDKRWIGSQLEGLQSSFGGLQSSFQGLQSYCEGLQSYMERRFEHQQAHFEIQLEKHRLALENKITDMETKLLTEFHKWASPTELRIRSHADAIRAIDLELELTKDRVTKLEPKQ